MLKFDGRVVYIHPRGLYVTVEKVVNGSKLLDTVMLSNSDRREWLAKYGEAKPVKKEPFSLPQDKSTKKIYKEDKHTHSIEKLMNCKNIEPYFGHEHKVKPTPQKAYLPGISALKAETLLFIPDTFIEKNGSKRTFYQGGHPMYCLDQRELNRLLDKGVIVKTTVSGKVERYDSVYSDRGMAMVKKIEEDKKRKNIVPKNDPNTPRVTTWGKADPLPVSMTDFFVQFDKWSKAHKSAIFEEKFSTYGPDKKIIVNGKYEERPTTVLYVEFSELNLAEVIALKDMYWKYPNASMFGYKQSENGTYAGRFYY